MSGTVNPRSSTTQVVAEALEIVAQAAARSATLAVLAADVCGCHGCHAEAATTVAWALSMVQAGAGPDSSVSARALDRWLYPERDPLASTPHQ